MKFRIRFFLSLLFFISNCDVASSKSESKNLLPLLLGVNVSEDAVCPPKSGLRDFAIATQVVDAPGANPNIAFGDPKKATNGVCGDGQFSGSFDVYSFSRYLTLGWNGGKVKNITGVDFIVYENGFQVAGTAESYFMEPFFVEVGNDKIRWCGFNPRYSGSLSFSSAKRKDWERFGGLTPVLWNMGKNKFSVSELFSSASSEGYMNVGGGDGFDLDNLTVDNSSYGISLGCDTNYLNELRSYGFSYLRMTSVQERTGAGSGGDVIPKPHNSFDSKVDIDGVLAKLVQTN
ncbi:LIC_13355 family lipoprotein [Leptospira sp. 'Mane']|uniref:LIC_13355 family lipoprotein n=1 Tax=Leptospira sp. 'Mane' TaxID=3387407 RepID=UPI00398B04F0